VTEADMTDAIKGILASAGIQPHEHNR
jgi:hypothetical protein